MQSSHIAGLFVQLPLRGLFFCSKTDDFWVPVNFCPGYLQGSDSGDVKDRHVSSVTEKREVRSIITSSSKGEFLWYKSSKLVVR